MPNRIKAYILFSADELKAPYSQELESRGLKARWFESLESLTENNAASPALIVLDLDVLAIPFSQALEQVRSRFPLADYIALSNRDSAELALQCIRGGFSDFLIKPISPEELAWSIEKSIHQQSTLSKIDDPRTGVLKAVTQLSACASAAAVRITTLEFLRSFVKAESALWIREERESVRVLAASPRVKEGPISKRLVGKSAKKISVLRARESKQRKLVYRCDDPKQGVIVLWGIPERLSANNLARVHLLLEHSEQCLANLLRLEGIKQQTFVDDLTGLHNSRYLKFALTKCVHRARYLNKKFSVLFIDVDHFKSVNEKHGHLVGSEFLIVIGKTVKNCVRRIDSVFRYGGDEFVVILQDTELKGALEIGERIRKNIEQRVFVMEGLRLQSTVSIGIATYPDHAADKDTLLKLADDALFEAKKSSRNTVFLAQ